MSEQPTRPNVEQWQHYTPVHLRPDQALAQLCNWIVYVEAELERVKAERDRWAERFSLAVAQDKTGELQEQLVALKAERDAALADAKAANTAQEQHCADAVELARQLQAANQRADDAVATEMKYRRLMWLSHGHNGIYGDDGEMQCCECKAYSIDYKRDPLEKVEAAYDAACMHRAAIRATKESRDATS